MNKVLSYEELYEAFLIADQEKYKYKEKLEEADDAVEYWQIECDKRNKVLDKIKEEIKKYKYTDSWGDTVVLAKYIEELLEEIE